VHGCSGGGGVGRAGTTAGGGLVPVHGDVDRRVEHGREPRDAPAPPHADSPPCEAQRGGSEAQGGGSDTKSEWKGHHAHVESRIRPQQQQQEIHTQEGPCAAAVDTRGQCAPGPHA